MKIDMSKELDFICDAAVICLAKTWYLVPECFIEKSSYLIYKVFFKTFSKTSDILHFLRWDIPTYDEYNNHSLDELVTDYIKVSNKRIGRTKAKLFKSIMGMLRGVPESEWSVILPQLDLKNPRDKNILFWLEQLQRRRRDE